MASGGSSVLEKNILRITSPIYLLDKQVNDEYQIYRRRCKYRIAIKNTCPLSYRGLELTSKKSAMESEIKLAVKLFLATKELRISPILRQFAL